MSLRLEKAAARDERKKEMGPRSSRLSALEEEAEWKGPLEPSKAKQCCREEIELSAQKSIEWLWSGEVLQLCSGPASQVSSEPA